MQQLPPNGHIHIVGIGGVGLSAIARILLAQGYTLSGSDRSESAYTVALARDGVTIHIGHAAENIAGADALLVTAAVNETHVEVAAARAAGVPVFQRADIIASIMTGKTVIAVAGTHGKTTTTGMIAHILITTGRDPSYIIGGTLSTTGQNGAAGKGDAFVIEADEYANMFHGLRPNIAVLTNVEWDHPDFFPTEGDMLRSFSHFVGLVSGTLIACADDAGALRLGETISDVEKTYYGIDAPAAQLKASAIQSGTMGYRFTAQDGQTVLGEVQLAIPGRHNVLNALAAIRATMLYGVPFAEAAGALASFSGTGRRFDVRGEIDSVYVIDDYAHHPTAIRATLEAARGRFPGHQVWAVWQPHTYSRTKALWNAYATAFGDADHVLVTPIYAAREQPVDGVDSAWLVRDMPHLDARYVASLDAATELLLADVQAPAVIVIMSAGDAPKIGEHYLIKRALK